MSLYTIRLNLELNPGPDKVYTVTSPDVPELVTEGSTPEEIAHNVQDAISCFIEVCQNKGWDLPPALRPEKALPVDNMSMLQVVAV